MKKYILGFDLGGTKMIAALLDDKFNVIEKKKTKTPAQEGPDAVLEAIVATIQSVIEGSGIQADEIEGIGIAVPGTIDREKGRVIYTPNLGFENVAISDYVKKHTGIRVVLENDVNAGAYGEWTMGAAKGYRHVIALFPGTGLGGALILNGALYRGAAGNAGEIGHMIIQTDGPMCGCGQLGCLEALASRSALSRDALLAAASGKAPETYREFGTDLKNYKSKTFSNALKRKEKPIIEIIDKGAHYLGIGMANCVNIFNPELILIGGGLVEKLGSSYLKKAEASMRAHAMASMVKGVEVKAAKLGDDAVFVGAAAVLKDEASA